MSIRGFAQIEYNTFVCIWFSSSISHKQKLVNGYFAQNNITRPVSISSHIRVRREQVEQEKKNT